MTKQWWRTGLFLVAAAVLAWGCGGKPRGEAQDPLRPRLLLKHGPVTSWLIPVKRNGPGNVFCRVTSPGMPRPGQHVMMGDALLLTVVDMDNVMTLVVGSEADGVRSENVFKIPHPPSGDMQIFGPGKVVAGPREQTLWRAQWRPASGGVYAVDLGVVQPPPAR